MATKPTTAPDANANGDAKVQTVDMPPLPKTMKVHPTARMFATLGGTELEDLEADIQANGIVVPIVVNKKRDTILDGRNRWMIASKLGIQSDVPYDVFQGKDDEIPSEILRLNVFRRHLTDDQRTAAIVKVRGPVLEKEGKARQAEGAKAGMGKTGSFKKDSKEETPTTVAQLAKEAKTTPYKAQQAEKARKAGLIDDVVQKKMTLKQAAAKAGSGTAKKHTKVLSLEDEVWKYWAIFLKHWSQPQHRDVLKHVQTFIDERRPLDSGPPSKAQEEPKKASAPKATAKAKGK